MRNTGTRSKYPSMRLSSRLPSTFVATTPTALYDELRARHKFTLPADRVRAAVNDDFVAATATLRDGDRIVFIPPVAGG